MNIKHDIVQLVYAAKEDNLAADDLVVQYLPFIKSETAKFINRPPVEGQDDELSIAMFAFYEAALKYEEAKGAFLPFAAQGIKFRLIDFQRKEKRHQQTLSLDLDLNDENDTTLLDQIASDTDPVSDQMEQEAAAQEIAAFVLELADFGLTLSDIAEASPKQERTLADCHHVLDYAIEHPDVFDALLTSKKLPLKQIVAGTRVKRKTLERHRKYLIAMLLAFTNGFEIIRGHLVQMAPGKGNQSA